MSIKNPVAFCDALFDMGRLNDCFLKNKGLKKPRVWPTDLDRGLMEFITEINGYFIFYEMKTDVQGDKRKIPEGQVILHNQLLKTGRFFIVNGYGFPLDNNRLTHIQTRSHKRTIEYPQGNGDLWDTMCEITTKWDKWAMTKPPYPSGDALDDIDYYLERMSILEFDGGYSREKAEETAMKMMLMRRENTSGN